MHNCSHVCVTAVQRNFDMTTCGICGLVYAPGEEADKKTHKAHCAAATQGVKAQVQHECNCLARRTQQTCYSDYQPLDTGWV